MNDARFLDPDSLIRNSAWMRRLARSLVADDARAEDVVQQAYVAAIERPPRGGGSLRGWLGTVVRHFAYRACREERRRSARERAIARRERSWNTPEKLAERVELQRRIAGMVLELEEPYRSTVILHFFHGLSPRSLAGEEGVAVTTIRSRLHRALAKLRRRLDARHGGDRQVWRAVLLPLVAPWTFVSGAHAAAGGNTLAAGSASSVSAAKLAAMSGGLFMTQKTIIAAGLALVAFLAGGVGLWKLGGAGDREKAETARRVEETQEHGDLQVELRRAEEELARVRSERDRLASSVAHLEGTLAQLREPRAEVADTSGGIEATVASGLDFAELARLIADNIELLPRRHDRRGLSAEEQAAMAFLGAELVKISARARELSPYPFFDGEILTELVTALFKDSLDLSDEQSAAVTELARSLAEGSPENPEQLPSLERYQLRRALLDNLWAGIEETLADEQLEDWAIVRDYSEEILQDEGRLEIGVSLGSTSLLRNWSLNALRMDGDSLPMDELAPIAESYAREGKAVLERYAQTDEELEALPGETRAQFEREMLKLQERFHREIVPLLSEEQRAELIKQKPVLIEFRFGRSVKSWGGGERYF